MYTTEREVEKFLEEYRRSRVIIETTIRAILNRALEFEKKFSTSLSVVYILSTPLWDYLCFNYNTTK